MSTPRQGNSSGKMLILKGSLPLRHRSTQSDPGPRNRAWQTKQLEKIVLRIRDSAVGPADYSTGDFVEDVKRACAREAIPFDNDIFNELVG